MSLLNEMLKDLNETKARAKATPLYLPLHKESFLQKLPSVIPWLFATFIISLLVLLMTHGLQIKKDKEIEGEPAAPLPSEALVQVKQQKQPATAKPAANKIQNESLGNLPARNDPSEPLFFVLPSFIPGISQFPDEDFAAEPTLAPNAHKPILTAAVKKTASSLSAREWHDLHLNEALQAIEEGEESHAIQLLTMILARFPASVEARESLAAIYLSRADLTKAMTILDKGLEYEPDSIILSKMKARIFFEQDKTSKALKLLARFKPDIRQDPDFYGLMAAILQSLGKNNEAGDLYKRLVEIEPSCGQYWLGYGMALEQRQAFQQAAIAYQHASQSYDVEPMVRIYAENRLKLLQG
ncbi:tetratricopeptide repeat protein [Legionella londiniensis]|uniref:Uncharacterized protein n=1 Tax=Legionella londiniensis TaxID=45068 RepID=A0A0W0VID8_9GAMM|nr:tetratricopeptide repeat protein [Legionella londiniensis]KTD19886.1 hypothetical protein Llon_2058 [Legionella londiniensis]STX94242.1 Predicted O-linked N-acetylglucosamine transferase, SPINDLY family [Legionella londiniensis]